MALACAPTKKATDAATRKVRTASVNRFLRGGVYSHGQFGLPRTFSCFLLRFMF